MTVPPRDENTSTSSAVLPDEAALEQSLLRHHAMLMDEARVALGDDGAAMASKVVEGAFVRAWDTRGTMQTAEQLEKFLIDDVHRASARALSRRAGAHRPGAVAAKSAHAKPADASPQESWAHVQHALHGEEHTHQTLTAMASASRHEAAGHMRVMAKSSKGTTTAIISGIAAIVLVVVGMKVMNGLAAKGAVASALNGQDMRVVTTPSGQAGNVNLADGTEARLAPESKLSLPKDFSPTLRGVKIEGAGNFDVAAVPEHDFELHAGNVVVVAKGGSFIVSAYPADSTVTVVVNAGAVDVRQDKTSQVLQKDAALTSRAGGPLRAATPEERDAASAWKTGTLVIADRRLADVTGMLKRWYGYDIKVAEPALKDNKVSVRVSLDSAMQAVHAIEKSAGVEFGYAGQNMIYRSPAKKGKK
ncbi:MAG: FecR protein [Gemmatimonadetes bacterium]|nr:FecR protein [Gemmatimonadota bacterium]